MNPYTDGKLSEIDQALARISECPGFMGTVIATGDGLILSSVGSLLCDAAAACAASLVIESEQSLSAVGSGPPKEIMIWTDNQVWYQTRLPTLHVILSVSDDMACSGALRMAVKNEFENISRALEDL